MIDLMTQLKRRLVEEYQLITGLSINVDSVVETEGKEYSAIMEAFGALLQSIIRGFQGKDVPKNIIASLRENEPEIDNIRIDMYLKNYYNDDDIATMDYNQHSSNTDDSIDESSNYNDNSEVAPKPKTIPEKVKEYNKITGLSMKVSQVVDRSGQPTTDYASFKGAYEVLIKNQVYNFIGKLSPRRVAARVFKETSDYTKTNQYLKRYYEYHSEDVLESIRQIDKINSYNELTGLSVDANKLVKNSKNSKFSKMLYDLIMSAFSMIEESQKRGFSGKDDPKVVVMELKNNGFNTNSNEEAIHRLLLGYYSNTTDANTMYDWYKSLPEKHQMLDEYQMLTGLNNIELKYGSPNYKIVERAYSAIISSQREGYPEKDEPSEVVRVLMSRNFTEADIHMFLLNYYSNKPETQVQYVRYKAAPQRDQVIGDYSKLTGMNFGGKQLKDMEYEAIYEAYSAMESSRKEKHTDKDDVARVMKVLRMQNLTDMETHKFLLAYYSGDDEAVSLYNKYQKGIIENLTSGQILRKYQKLTKMNFGINTFLNLLDNNDPKSRKENKLIKTAFEAIMKSKQRNYASKLPPHKLIVELMRIGFIQPSTTRNEVHKFIAGYYDNDINTLAKFFKLSGQLDKAVEEVNRITNLTISISMLSETSNMSQILKKLVFLTYATFLKYKDIGYGDKDKPQQVLKVISENEFETVADSLQFLVKYYEGDQAVLMHYEQLKETATLRRKRSTSEMFNPDRPPSQEYHYTPRELYMWYLQETGLPMRLKEWLSNSTYEEYALIYRVHSAYHNYFNNFKGGSVLHRLATAVRLLLPTSLGQGRLRLALFLDRYYREYHQPRAHLHDLMTGESTETQMRKTIFYYVASTGLSNIVSINDIFYNLKTSEYSTMVQSYNDIMKIMHQFRSRLPKNIDPPSKVGCRFYIAGYRLTGVPKGEDSLFTALTKYYRGSILYIQYYNNLKYSRPAMKPNPASQRSYPPIKLSSGRPVPSTRPLSYMHPSQRPLYSSRNPSRNPPKNNNSPSKSPPSRLVPSRRPSQIPSRRPIYTHPSRRPSYSPRKPYSPLRPSIPSKRPSQMPFSPSRRPPQQMAPQGDHVHVHVYVTPPPPATTEPTTPSVPPSVDDTSTDDTHSPVIDMGTDIMETEAPTTDFEIPGTDTKGSKTDMADTKGPVVDIIPGTDVMDMEEPITTTKGPTAMPTIDITDTEVTGTYVPEIDITDTRVPETDMEIPGIDDVNTEVPTYMYTATTEEINTVDAEVPDHGAIDTKMPGIYTEAPGTDIVDTEVLGTGVVDTEVPGTGVVDTEVPGTGVVDTEVPGTGVVATEVPGTGVVDTEVPGTDIIDTEVPGIKKPGMDTMADGLDTGFDTDTNTMNAGVNTMYDEVTNTDTGPAAVDKEDLNTNAADYNIMDHGKSDTKNTMDPGLMDIDDSYTNTMHDDIGPNTMDFHTMDADEIGQDNEDLYTNIMDIGDTGFNTVADENSDTNTMGIGGTESDNELSDTEDIGPDTMDNEDSVPDDIGPMDNKDSDDDTGPMDSEDSDTEPNIIDDEDLDSHTDDTEPMDNEDYDTQHNNDDSKADTVNEDDSVGMHINGSTSNKGNSCTRYSVPLTSIAIVHV